METFVDDEADLIIVHPVHHIQSVQLPMHYPACLRICPRLFADTLYAFELEGAAA